MAGLGERASYQQRAMGTLLVVTVLLGVLGLPVAVWLDLQILSERVLRMQVSEASRIIDAMRNFYGSDVFGRVLQSPEPVRVLQSPEPVMVTHKYRDIAGAIPIPATLSIELGKRISAQDGSVKYRFVSDMPFKGREPHQLDGFEKEALARLKANPEQPVVEVSGSLFDKNIRTAAPVVMGQGCVTCHNAHPDSPKTDWKVGDVRGIQEISVRQHDLGDPVALPAALLLEDLEVGGRHAALARNLESPLEGALGVARRLRGVPVVRVHPELAARGPGDRARQPVVV